MIVSWVSLAFLAKSFVVSASSFASPALCQGPQLAKCLNLTRSNASTCVARRIEEGTTIFHLMRKMVLVILRIGPASYAN
ncbi:putative secreted protein (plasmid) [Pseudomonas syringae pv. avii]|uniref:Secreted protein n=1 Tax=Pseudomonas syringae pv. avii TaxID=663959 RepID=A0ABY1UG81_PSESX|nr:putative secreted protein [Pseudomonas syringae pv. avii]